MKFDDAERFLDLAIAANPSDSLAMLHKSALYQFTDRGKSGYGLNLHARALSPRDPHRYVLRSDRGIVRVLGRRL